MELAAALISIIIVIAAIYLAGKALSPKPPKSGDKLMPYACGESLPPARGPVRLTLFSFAALFMVFDVIALFLAFAIRIPQIYKPNVVLLTTIYGAVLLAAIHLLGRR